MNSFGLLRLQSLHVDAEIFYCFQDDMESCYWKEELTLHSLTE